MAHVFYRMACQLSACSAALCAVLALLASPMTARADYSADCMACCTAQGLTGPDLLQCVGQCSMGVGSCAAATCPVACLNCQATNKGGVVVVSGNCMPDGVAGCGSCKGCGLTKLQLPNGDETFSVFCKV